MPAGPSAPLPRRARARPGQHLVEDDKCGGARERVPDVGVRVHVLRPQLPKLRERSSRQKSAGRSGSPPPSALQTQSTSRDRGRRARARRRGRGPRRRHRRRTARRPRRTAAAGSPGSRGGRARRRGPGPAPRSRTRRRPAAHPVVPVQTSVHRTGSQSANGRRNARSRWRRARGARCRGKRRRTRRCRPPVASRAVRRATRPRPRPSRRASPARAAGCEVRRHLGVGKIGRRVHDRADEIALCTRGLRWPSAATPNPPERGRGLSPLRVPDWHPSGAGLDHETTLRPLTSEPMRPVAAGRKLIQRVPGDVAGDSSDSPAAGAASTLIFPPKTLPCLPASRTIYRRDQGRWRQGGGNPLGRSPEQYMPALKAGRHQGDL